MSAGTSPRAQAATDCVVSVSANPVGADRYRLPSEWLSDPCVRIWFRAGTCDAEMVEHFGGPQGPDPVWVVRRALDRLALPAHRVVAEPHESGQRAAWLTREFNGERIARIDGLDDDQVNTALIALHLSGFTPRPPLAAATPGTVATLEAELARRAVERDGYVSRAQARAETRLPAEPDRSADARPRRRRPDPATAQQETLL